MKLFENRIAMYILVHEKRKRKTALFVELSNFKMK